MSEMQQIKIVQACRVEKGMTVRFTQHGVTTEGVVVEDVVHSGEIQVSQLSLGDRRMAHILPFTHTVEVLAHPIPEMPHGHGAVVELRRPEGDVIRFVHVMYGEGESLRLWWKASGAVGWSWNDIVSLADDYGTKLVVLQEGYGA